MSNLVEILITAKNLSKPAFEGVAADSGMLSSTMGKMGLGIAGALVGIGVEATKMATTFQASNTRLVTSAGESASNIKLVGDGMLNMAGQVGISAIKLSQGMYTVESAGFHGADGLTVLKAAAQGAKDENAQLGTVANAVTDVLLDYHLKASAAADVTSKLVTAVSFGKTDFQSFSSAMSNILPIAGSVHLSLADVSGVLAEMTAHGMTAQRASQNEAQAIRSLIAPSGTMTKEFKLMGITAEEVTQKMGSVGLAGTMQWLSSVAAAGAPKVGQNYTEALKKLMGTAPGLSVALMTTGENANATNAAIAGVAHATADANGNVKGFAEVQKTLAQQLAQVNAGFDSMMIRLGTMLMPRVSEFITLLETKGAPVLHSFAAALSAIGSGFSTPAKALQQAVHAAVSHPTIGPVLQKAGSFTQNLGAFSPFLPNGPTAGMLLPEEVIPTIGPITQRAAGAALTQNIGAAAAPSMVQTPRRFNPFLPGPTAGMLMATPKVPAPDMTPWQKVGQVLARVAADFRTFAGEAATALGHLLTAAQPTLALLGGAFLVALRVVGGVLASVVGPALVKVSAFMEQHKQVIRDLVAVALVPLALRLSALAVIKPVMAIAGLAKDVVMFPINQAQQIVTSMKGVTKSLFGAAEVTDAEGNVTPAVKGLFAKVGSAFSTGWDAVSKGASTFWRGLGRGASAASSGLQTAFSAVSTYAGRAGTALANAGQGALTLASNAGKAVASMASSAWAGAVTGAKAIATAMAEAAAAAWDFAVKAAAATAAALRQAGAFVIDQVATAAEALATVAETVATTVGTAALTAFDIVLAIATSPITLVIAAILGLVAAIVWIATKTTWFETAWRYTWNAIKSAAVGVWHVLDTGVIHPLAAAFSWLWSGAIAPALRFIVGGFLNMAGSILHAAAAAFSWVPGIGGQLKTANAAFGAFKNSVMSALGGATSAANGLNNAINNLPPNKTIDINVAYHTSGNQAVSTTGYTYAHGGIAAAATGGARGGMVWVGEQGPELVKLPSGSTVVPSGQSRALAARGGGSGAQTIHLEIHSGGSNFDDALAEIIRKYVRLRGGSVQTAFGRS